MLAVTRAGNLFTTHTAVSAGFDRFSPSLMECYLGTYVGEQPGIDVQTLLALGRADPHDAEEYFNMAYLAVRGSGAVNGVSRLHREVSRRLFQDLFPRWPAAAVLVGHATNGVHRPSWDSAGADELWTETCGKRRWRCPTEQLAETIRGVSSARLWQLRSSARQSLIEYARAHLRGLFTMTGGSRETCAEAAARFDPNVPTLGFARRFTAYKRPDLLLYDPARLLSIPSNPQQPV